MAPAPAARPGPRVGEGQAGGRAGHHDRGGDFRYIMGFRDLCRVPHRLRGTFGFKPMLEAFTAPLIGIVYYIGVRLVRRAQGMQLSQAFEEIPPE